MVIFTSCSKDDYLKGSGTDEPTSHTSFSFLNYPAAIKKQLTYYDREYSTRDLDNLSSFRKTHNSSESDPIKYLNEFVKGDKYFDDSHILWGYMSDIGVLTDEGEVPKYSPPGVDYYIVPIASKSIYNLTGYLHFQYDGNRVSRATVYKSNDEAIYSLARFLRDYTVSNMLNLGAEVSTVDAVKLRLTTHQMNDLGGIQKGCMPIFGQTSDRILSARMTGYGEKIEFTGPGDNNYYFRNGVTFDYYGTDYYSTTIKIINIRCDDNYNPTPGTTTIDYSKGGTVSGSTPTQYPPCITINTTFSPGAKSGAVILSGWSFKIPGIIDANGAEIVVNFKESLYVSVGYNPYLFGSSTDKERTIRVMNQVLKAAQAESFNTIYGKYNNVYRPNYVYTHNLTGYQLERTISKDVVQSLRNSFITNMMRLDPAIDPKQLTLEEAKDAGSYKVRPGATKMANCVFSVP